MLHREPSRRAHPAAATVAAPFDVDRVRLDFPILESLVWCKPLVYLDNAASAHKPQVVLDAVQRFYAEQNSNVHRGVHYLSGSATRLFEESRDKVQRYLNAASREEIVFVRGATEGINLVAQSFARPRLREGDEILITHMEHHANIVPWQIVCEQTGARLVVVPIDDAGDLELDRFERLLGDRTRLVALTHVSNALGTINPVREIIARAHERDVPVLLDGAQAVPHMPVDIAELGCDFYVWSGHKAFGPTGIGVLHGKRALLEEMPPYQGGGDMIRTVSFEKTTYNELPYKFEAGTPNVAGAIGLGAAVDYLGALDMEAAAVHEHDLLEYATARLGELEWLRIIGTAREKASVISFVMDSAHPHDIGTILDQDGVAIRTGHHCAQPVMARYGVVATARASFAFYNLRSEVDALVAGLHRVHELFN
jgi:cysteine desulfurase/selenocysteine lyase